MKYLEQLKDIVATGDLLAMAIRDEENVLREMYVNGRRGSEPTDEQRNKQGHLSREIKRLKENLRHLLKDFHV